MADRGSELGFFQGIHVRADIRIDISVSIRPMTIKFGKQVHLQESTQMKLIKQLLVTSPLYLHYHSAYCHQIWQGDDYSSGTSTHNITLPLGHVVLRNHLTN